MTALTATTAAVLKQYTAQLAEPAPPPPDEPWTVQSLADGAAGISLLHIEMASRYGDSWRPAHRWITAAAAGQISAADTTGLFLGAPALGFVLTTVPPPFQHLYDPARGTLHQHITDLAHRRVDAALTRIRKGDLPTFAEYDLFYGLTGIGAYLLRADPEGLALERVLRYLVALTRPLASGGLGLPGWWVRHDPARGESPHFPGGHANFGAAHGITGPLLLLAQALRRGITVDGHHEAMWTICEHLGVWCQLSPSGPWWPEHVSRRDFGRGRPHHDTPARPSWCYGTTGIARAGQLAGLALRAPDLQAFYEDALYRALTDPEQLAHVTDTGLCHGWAGIYQTATRAAADALDPRLQTLTKRLGDTLAAHAQPGGLHTTGLINGDAGTALALTTYASPQAPITGWDACLLIN
ncbi:lanthionine synthetase C family protein [Streptomyces sp. NBC_00439]|uniref:lanthionine synthetase C family protein n=1 Tax=Streptomyces sp. NBC_00439 TaxID=2903650 RepID=UPI00224F7369|nr:lanthionine synthetase C family protein [Streptomyces sp. NBC_00439]MCX5100412.1 lanthionine synthetase C family protein [Streptomyces sp. NBC_00439]